MNPADGEAPHIDAAPRPSASGDPAPPDAAARAKAASRGCPFLVAEAGGWRLDQPSRAHRCGAVSPPAALSPEKQARLCLTATHTTCATLLASVAARDARLGVPAADRATRWGLARTTTVIEEPGGIRSRVAGLLLDRGRWPAIPAVLLVVTLITLAASGFRPGAPAAAEATPTPARPGPTPAVTATPTAAETPPVAPSAAATSRPTTGPSAAPQPTSTASAGFTTYRVRSGDTLSGIASTYKTTSRAIADLNGISVTATLRIGQVLKIPT